MKLDTITMDPAEAKAKAREYREAFRRSRRAEDEAIWRGLKALGRGHSLVDINKAVLGGGEFDNGFPRIAVCQADALWCYLSRTPGGDVCFVPNRPDAPDMPLSPQASRSTTYIRGQLSERHWGDSATPWWRDRCYRTQVPLVPPPLRPASAQTLRSYHILWEVEEWAKHTPPRPPGDPALLRHVTGSLYAVLAVWDLSDLERAVLGARR